MKVINSLLIAVLSPILLPELALFYWCKASCKCKEDLNFTLRHRGNPYKKEALRFLYFMVWLPEYRSIFYRRIGVIGKLFNLVLPGQKLLYIRMSSNAMGGGICVNHGHSTELNAKTIGSNCIFFQNVTIGTNGSRIGPTIGNNCFFGAGCVVVGDITIGNNVKVGANAIVTKSIPDNCTVVTTGTTIVKQNGEKVNIKV